LAERSGLNLSTMFRMVVIAATAGFSFLPSVVQETEQKTTSPEQEPSHA